MRYHVVQGQRVDDSHVAALHGEVVGDADGKLYDHGGTPIHSRWGWIREVLVQTCRQIRSRPLGEVNTVLAALGRVEHALQALERGHSPADDFGRQGIELFLAVHLVRKSTDVLFDFFHLAAQIRVEARVEAVVENLVDDPSRDDGTAYRRHLLLARLQGVGADILVDPAGQRDPILADVEREVIDGAIQAIEPCRVLAVVERRTRLRHALVGNGVLQLLDLSGELINLVLAVEVQPLDVLVFDDFAWDCQYAAARRIIYLMRR